jgi:hypothetical protein
MGPELRLETITLDGGDAGSAGEPVQTLHQRRQSNSGYRMTSPLRNSLGELLARSA